MPKILITGANGNIGQRLIRELAADVPGDWSVRAFVRSDAAKAQLAKQDLPAEFAAEVVVGAYTDLAAMVAAAEGCHAVVHLVGIIKESQHNSFADAHVAATRRVAEAMQTQGIDRVVYLSILGADLNHPNPCLQTKAQAEDILQQAAANACMLRVPMVLGEGDYASAALIGRAMKNRSVALRADSLEQPIYVGDVVAAIKSGLGQKLQGAPLELAGPESLTRRALINRTASLLGREAKVLSLPISLGLAAAGIFERLSANPPVTRAMLGVLDHDDAIDPQPALDALGIELTPLDEALQHCINEWLCTNKAS